VGTTGYINANKTFYPLNSAFHLFSDHRDFILHDGIAEPGTADPIVAYLNKTRRKYVQAKTPQELFASKTGCFLFSVITVVFKAE
jgi:hypothetical protein